MRTLAPATKVWLEIDGDGCAELITWGKFVADNPELGELVDVEAALLNDSYFEGGGGAWLAYTIRPAVTPPTCDRCHGALSVTSQHGEWWVSCNACDDLGEVHSASRDEALMFWERGTAGSVRPQESNKPEVTP